MIRANNMRVPSGIRVGLWLWLGLLALVPQTARGQSMWDYSPYDVRVWIAVDPQLGDAADIAETLRADLQRQASIAFFPDWKVTVEACPAALAVELADPSQTISVDRLRTVELAEARKRAVATQNSAATNAEPSPQATEVESTNPQASGSEAVPKATSESPSQSDVLRADKLFVVAISGQESPRLYVRELDCRFRQWSAPVDRELTNFDVAAEYSIAMMTQVFSPIARIEKVEGKQVTAKARAGGLVTAANSIVLIRPGDILLPGIRRTPRSTSTSEPAKTITDVPPWTYIQVEAGDGKLISGKTHTGISQPIPVKAGARVERLAMVVRRPYPSSKLTLVSRDRLKTPLSGYEIFAKIPGEEEAKFVGLSDYRGEFLLEQNQFPLRVLYLKNGGQLLARLPVVAGSVTNYTLSLPNDDRRLEVEGIVQALQTEVIDLVARREILAARIRNRLEKADVEGAKKLLETYRTLRTRDDLSKKLDADMKRILPSLPPGEKLTRVRVEKLFADAQTLLGKFLDPAAVDRLSDEIKNAGTK
jgi:hypothetical protein